MMPTHKKGIAFRRDLIRDYDVYEGNMLLVYFLLCTWRSMVSKLHNMIIGFRGGKGGKQPFEIGENMKEFIFLATIISANP